MTPSQIELIQRLLQFFTQRQLGCRKTLPQWAVFNGTHWDWISDEFGEVVAKLQEMVK